MRSAFSSRDIVNVGKKILSISVIMLHCHFHDDAVFTAADINRIIVYACFVQIKLFDKIPYPTFIMELSAPVFAFRPVVLKGKGNTPI